MSADNVIYIQRQKDGRFAVWETQISNENTEPHNAAYEPTLEEALAYARGWERGEWIIEYGVQILPSLAPPEEKKPIKFYDFNVELQRICTCRQVIEDEDGNLIPKECICATT
ncbi:hypothetical protein LCGC14_1094200 [marine sediment metagenome]|uniref:Uncharacterized protein n=1 Tax=marine sediment metagenome TaxID=412755 RepID=A0A0F9MFX8_9ZZZZ